MENAADTIIDAITVAPEWARSWPFSALYAPTHASWLEGVAASFRASRCCDYFVFAQADDGLWRRLLEGGIRQPLPTDLLSAVLDSETSVHQPEWWGAVSYQSQEGQAVLAVHRPRTTILSQAAFGSLAVLLGASMRISLDRERQSERERRLEQMLRYARDWNRTLETEPLLHKLAQAAAELLEADRASIFLWNKPAKTLVGKPALGVPGGELRIPDDKGLVGKVLASGEPGRVDLQEGQEVIDRRVDKTTGYVTRTLLAVPMFAAEKQPLGVFEVINKREGNFSDDDLDLLTELAAHAAIALQNSRTREQLLATNRNVAEQAAAGVQMVGQCPAIAALRNTVKRVAETDLAILILGENGTGKEVVSRSIHYSSARRIHPFVAVNCAAIAESLLESELFGHEKGAFTDAHSTRQGKFELASGGTLFLDEIGDLSLAGQAKLLRVLEDKIVVRVGGSTPISTDVRVIAATNQDLGGLVRERKFREDLYYRLNVVTLELPPLRMRSGDVVLLAEHFLIEFSRRAGRNAPVLTDGAKARLINHAWPGNVRELRNLMERIAFLNVADSVSEDELSFANSQTSDAAGIEAPLGLSLARATDDFQSRYIERTIDATNGAMTEVAKRLGLHRSNLYRKMRQLGMNPRE